MSKEKVECTSPFVMGKKKYAPGDSVSVEKEKAKDLAFQGLVKGKGLDGPPKDKMVEKSPKKKAGGKKK